MMTNYNEGWMYSKLYLKEERVINTENRREPVDGGIVERSQRM